jgi:hypothetical protein
MIFETMMELNIVPAEMAALDMKFGSGGADKGAIKVGGG